MSGLAYVTLSLVFALSGWQVVGYCQSPITYVTVGQTAIAIRAPRGFIDPRIVKPETAAAINSRTPPGNRNLSYLITGDDLRRMESGVEPKLERLLRIEVLRGLEAPIVSEARFKEYQDAARTPIPRAGMRIVGVFDETRYSISWLNVGNGAVAAASLVHVQGKLLYVFADALESSDKDGAWTKEISKTFVRLILEANKQSVGAL